MLAIARKGMDGSEATFSVESEIAVHVSLYFYIKNVLGIPLV